MKLGFEPQPVWSGPNWSITDGSVGILRWIWGLVVFQNLPSFGRHKRNPVTLIRTNPPSSVSCLTPCSPPSPFFTSPTMPLTSITQHPIWPRCHNSPLIGAKLSQIWHRIIVTTSDPANFAWSPSFGNHSPTT